MNFRRQIISLSAVMVWSVPAYSQDGNLEALVEKARVAMKESQWEQALDFNTQAVTRFGQDQPLRKYGAQFGTIYYQKGVCEMKRKRWDEAMRSFEICYRDFPNDGSSSDAGNPFQIMALCKWGEAAMGAENWEVAASRFAKFIEERDRTRDKFPQGAFYINLAVCQYKLGRIAEGNENLEIAIQNRENFPTPESGITAAFQALVTAAITRPNEQALLDFIGKNRGALVMDSPENPSYSGVLLTLAGDALAAGMQRAALALYQLLPPAEADVAGVDSPAAIRLAAVALIHEKNGNVRGAFAAYEQLVTDHPGATDRESHLYQLVRTASVVGESDASRRYAQWLYREFPKSEHLTGLRASGYDFTEREAATVAASPPASKAPAGVLPKSREFVVALDLYQGRKYQEARAAFLEIKKRRKSAMFAPFYEMECLRKLGDLDGLAVALRGFVKNPTLGGQRLRQLEIDALWDAVRTKNWERIDQLAKPLNDLPLPGDQRAQVAYCHGLALEKRSHPTEALHACNIAMTADAGASEEIARQAALLVMEIHRADPEVQAAIANWGKSGEDRDSPGFFRLKEAASLAAFFELSLGAGMPLPEEMREFLKYRNND